MNRSIFILFLLVVSTVISAQKLAVLPEVLKPNGLVIDGDRLYITSDITTVYLYSIKSLTSPKQFVKKGEGPGESTRPFSSLKVYPGDRLTVEDYPRKIMFFTKDGEFKSEQRYPQGLGFISCIGENYVGRCKHIDNEKGVQYYTINLLDKEFKTIKVLHKGEELEIFTSGKAPRKIVTRPVQNYLACRVYEDHIYVFDTRRGFSITVFDSSGNRLREINKEYTKIKIPGSFIDNFMNRMKKTAIWERIEARYHFEFPTYFPAFTSRYCLVNNGKIYVLTFDTKETKETGKKERELVALDLKGKVLKRMFVPDIDERYIDNGTYYYLHENEEKEVWELHALDIK